MRHNREENTKKKARKAKYIYWFVVVVVVACNDELCFVTFLSINAIISAKTKHIL